MARAAAATILHADLDAFYASVEQLLDPGLRGRPVAVGGSVVLAASYEARAFGVRSGMAGGRARRLCPHLVFVGGHFGEYGAVADRVMAVFEDFTPLVERVSIDEAFLEVTGAVHLFGPPGDIAASIRRRVREEIGLAVSVGVARTKHLAKVASQVAKPDGLVVVDPGDEQQFLRPLPVGLIWGVGPVTAVRLAAAGIRTIGELAATGSPVLEHLLGRTAGAKLSSLAANVDPRPVRSGRPASSIGAQCAFGATEADSPALRPTLAYLAERVAGRLRAGGRAARTVTVRVRFVGGRSLARSRTLALPVAATLALAEAATDLVLAALEDHRGDRRVTLLAVSVSRLLADPGVQLELPLRWSGDGQRGPAPSDGTHLDLDRAVDEVRACFGRGPVGDAGVVLSGRCRVPEAFRGLAERPVIAGER